MPLMHPAMGITREISDTKASRIMKESLSLENHILNNGLWFGHKNLPRSASDILKRFLSKPVCPIIV